MRKLAIAVSAAALVVAVPAQAHKGGPAGGKGHGKAESAKHNTKANKGKRCYKRYVAAGLFVSGTVTQVAGADTTKTSDDRYDGSVVVAVKSANKRAKAHVGTTQTYTLDGARVRFKDTNGDGTVDMPAAGDRAKVFGWIQRDTQRCNADGGDPEMKISKVRFNTAPAAETTS